MVSNYTLRRNARMQLGNNIFKRKWLMMLVICAVLPLIAALVVTLYKLRFDVFEIIGVVAFLIVLGPLLFGKARASVACVEARKWDLSQIFSGFKEDFTSSMLLGFLEFLLIVMWTLLFVVPGVIKAYSYSMAFYIQQEKENKGKEPLDCIEESRRMMHGHKWQLFWLDISFVVWYVIGTLCLGIGVFFVIPYHQMARANFYEALKAQYRREQAEIRRDTEKGESYDQRKNV